MKAELTASNVVWLNLRIWLGVREYSSVFAKTGKTRKPEKGEAGLCDTASKNSVECWWVLLTEIQHEKGQLIRFSRLIS